MQIRHVSGPAAEPVTTDEALAQVRTQGAAAETILAGHITSAREYIERIIQHPLVTQTFDGYLRTFPDRTYIDIPLGGLQTVTSIIYTTAAGSQITLDPESYMVDTIDNRIYLALGYHWPAASLADGYAVRVRFTAGYTSCPGPLKQALLLMVGHFWENTEAVVAEPGIVASPMPLGFERLIENYKRCETA